MPDSAAFDLVCEVLEASTELDRLQARGTVRLALRDSGLDPRTVTPEQMGVAVEQVLPGALESRGVKDHAGVRVSLRDRLRTLDAPTTADESPEAVFARLGGG
jgi:predicted nucleotidyltransferase